MVYSLQNIILHMDSNNCSEFVLAAYKIKEYVGYVYIHLV